MSTYASDILDQIEARRSASTKTIALALGLPPVVARHWLLVLRQDNRVQSYRGRWWLTNAESDRRRVQQQVAAAFGGWGVGSNEAAASLAAIAAAVTAAGRPGSGH